MRRQKTFNIALRDRETGLVCAESLRLYRSGKIIVNPTPGVCMGAEMSPEVESMAFNRIAMRRIKLAGLLLDRTFGSVDREGGTR